MSSKLQFLTPYHKGWERAWQCIENTFGSRTCHNETSNEVWQYMASTEKEHQFRHRDLPSDIGPYPAGRTYFGVPVEADDYQDTKR